MLPVCLIKDGKTIPDAHVTGNRTVLPAMVLSSWVALTIAHVSVAICLLPATGLLVTLQR